MDERRQFKRFEASFAVLLRAADDGSKRAEAQMLDLSFSGIGVTVHDPLAIGERLVVEVHGTGLASDPVVIGEGEVANTESAEPGSTRPRQAGIRFTNADTTVLRQLLQRIQARRLSESKRHLRTSRQRPKKTREWL